MPIPQHPPKLDSEPLVTPHQTRDTTEATGTPIPDGIILSYSRTLFEHVTNTYDGTHIDRYFGDLYILDDTVGILGNFGIGAPTTALLMEELIADGATTFLSIGYAGSLDRSIEFGDYILCSEAIRDEGTSHHYLHPDADAHPTPTLFDHLETHVSAMDHPYHIGPSWTIDAVYQETVAEVQHYANHGVLTVEMEAAAVYAVATHHDVEAAAMFVVSDYLTPDDWTADFERAIEDLYHLTDTAINALSSYQVG